MSISQDGNVGIGTTSPEFTLDVNGDLRVGPYATFISGDIDMEDGSTYDANTYYVWHFPASNGAWPSGGKANCITVKIGRAMHTSEAGMVECHF